MMTSYLIIFLFKDLFTEALDVKFDSGLHISKCFFIGVAFVHDHAFHAQGICHISIGMLFNDDLHLAHEGCLLCKFPLTLPSPHDGISANLEFLPWSIVVFNSGMTKFLSMRLNFQE